MCRTVCDYEYITDQIRAKRQKYLMIKLLPPIPDTRIHPNPNPMNQQHFPQHIPKYIIIITIFIIEVTIVIYLVTVITQTVFIML